MNDACRECPARLKRAGCGYQPQGQRLPCRHPAHRDEWQRAEQRQEAGNARDAD